MIGMSPPDGWDRWVADRDARYANVRSYDYVSADIAGVEDLDQYGRWQQVPNYGWCWTPATVAVGWQPYRVGRWIWQDPWGWTWVSSEPWGWAPYHYGRWVTWSSRWFWVPVAPRVAVVTYSPALVAFVGGGPGFSVSVGVGTDYIGWFPLAPRDPLIPWWGRPPDDGRERHEHHLRQQDLRHGRQPEHVRLEPRGRRRTTSATRASSTASSRRPSSAASIPIVPTRESIRVSTRAGRGRPASGERGLPSRRDPDGAAARSSPFRHEGRRDPGEPGTSGDDGRGGAHRRARGPRVRSTGSSRSARPRRNRGVSPSLRRPKRRRHPSPSRSPRCGDGRSPPRNSRSRRRGRLRLSVAGAPLRSARPSRKALQGTRSRNSATRPRDRPAKRRKTRRRASGFSASRPKDSRTGASPHSASRRRSHRLRVTRPSASRPKDNRPSVNRLSVNRRRSSRPRDSRRSASRPRGNRPNASKRKSSRRSVNRPRDNRPNASKRKSSRRSANRRSASKPKSRSRLRNPSARGRHPGQPPKARSGPSPRATRKRSRRLPLPHHAGRDGRRPSPPPTRREAEPDSTPVDQDPERPHRRALFLCLWNQRFRAGS